ncbi:hypothetical protein AB0M41_26665 [Streptomyces sp. NPDC051896]|uniref:hypothetical protein n=1 Tax=Streptomyces sp. NPDC051896 TaxID=3155416 RepID=UPI0034367F3C
MRWMMGSANAIGAANIAAATNSPQLLQHYLDLGILELAVNPILETFDLRQQVKNIRAVAIQAAQSGHSVTPWSLELQTHIGEFLTQHSPTIGARLANAFAGGAHLGWGFMRCHQAFQVDTVETNLQQVALHLKTINDGGIALPDYANRISELNRQYAEAKAGNVSWQALGDCIAEFCTDTMQELPPP